MKITIQTTKLSKPYDAVIIIGLFEDGHLTTTGKVLDKATKGYLSSLYQQGIFGGKIGQHLPLFKPANTPFKQILLVGCGQSKNLSETSFRKIIFATMKALNTYQPRAAICYLTELSVPKQTLPWHVKQITEATYDALYHYDVYKSEKEPPITLKELIIHLPTSKHRKASDHALKQGQAIGEGVTLTKNLANMPSNICTPSWMANYAKQLGKKHSALTVKILGEKEMRKLHMGAILAVAKGSREEAKLICIEYKGSKKKSDPIVLIGKGVTFDTGGNSIKPADAMVGMKYDMCGAATVLGTLVACSQLKLPLHIVGIMPTVENMPGGAAYKPEDILKSMSGQTIEVISTDAEGRLILADALTYCERYKPDVVIDIATLTGAVVVSLGMHAIGLLSNHQPLANALLAAGEESNDRAWQLPLWDDYQDQIKSPFADMANSGGRSAGTITAACNLILIVIP